MKHKGIKKIDATSRKQEAIFKKSFIKLTDKRTWDLFIDFEENYKTQALCASSIIFTEVVIEGNVELLNTAHRLHQLRTSSIYYKKANVV
jgi:hypothetical protein